MKVFYNEETRLQGEKPIKSWCNEPEDGALQQAINLARLPFLYKHVALMPDTHFGYGMPIGGVIATKGVVIPNAVGVDIGCGMCAVKTNLKWNENSPTSVELKKIMKKIREKIPLGKNDHKEPQDEKLMPKFEIEPVMPYPMYPIVLERFNCALKQLGTLGGGNHFIEIQKDEDGYVWIMVHSGSRNLGKRVADYHNNVAKGLNEMWYTKVEKEWDLAFLPIQTKEAKSYMKEMKFCLDYAFANRKLMMGRITEAIDEVLGATVYQEMINIHHNYATWENHYGKDVIVHRKGATLAREGTIGIIPGSQGTASYIVKGKGNHESFNSCSHGAGRKMGRKAAIRGLDLKSEIMRLEEKGIIHSIRSEKDLDEASGAYKDIDIVMDEQKDLVEIVTKLEPLAVIKG